MQSNDKREDSISIQTKLEISNSDSGFSGLSDDQPAIAAIVCP